MKEAEQKSVVLKLTGAIALDGQIARAGSLVEMSESEAKDLLRRGKAELATEYTGPTVSEFVAAGYQATDYPPHGYASRSTEEEIQAAIAAQAASTAGAPADANTGADTTAPVVDDTAAATASEADKPAAAPRNTRRAS